MARNGGKRQRGVASELNVMYGGVWLWRNDNLGVTKLWQQ